jgi:hypothetical protein
MLQAMLTAYALQMIGLVIASLPRELRRQHGVFLLAAAWVTLGFGIIAAFVIVLPEYYDPAWLGPDRFNYEAEYADAATGIYPDFEFGFALFTDLFARAGIAPVAYFLLIFVCNILMLHFVVSSLFRRTDWIIVYFFFFYYFIFFEATLNVIRQSLGIALCCIAIVYFLKQRLRLCCLLIILAACIHSACIFTFVIFLTLFRRLGVWSLTAVVIGVFALSAAGITEYVYNTFEDVTGLYIAHVEEYTNSAWAWEIYTGGVFRTDFLIFSLIPILPYAYFRIPGSKDRDDAAFVFYEKLMKVYVSLIIPFAFFSYMLFSDRYALTAWILLPMMILWPLLYLENRQEVRMWTMRVVLVLIALSPNLITSATLLRISQELL